MASQLSSEPVAQLAALERALAALTAKQTAALGAHGARFCVCRSAVCCAS